MKSTTVILIVAFIWLFDMVTGSLSGSTMIALLFFVVLGVAVPVVGIPLGLLFIVYLFYARGSHFFGWVQTKIGGKKS